MKLQRTARLHQAATDPVLWWEFMPGDRVMVVEGFLGTVVSVDDGPVAGAETYQVELDAGLGGGEYGSEELTAVEGVGRAAVKTAGQNFQTAEVRVPIPSNENFFAAVSKKTGLGKGEFFLATVDYMGSDYWRVKYLLPEDMISEVTVDLKQANSANPGAYAGQPMVPPAQGTEEDTMDPEQMGQTTAPPPAQDDNAYTDQNNPYMAVASDDYPMLSEILEERPPLPHSERVAKTANNSVPVRIRRAAGYIVEDEDGLVVAGPFVSRLDAEAAERAAREEGQSNLVITRQGMKEAASDDGWYEGGAKTSDMYRLRAGKAHYWRDGEPLCGKTDKYGRPPARGRKLGSLVGNACAICDRRLTREREERIRQMREGMAQSDTKPFKDAWWLERFLVPLAEDMIARQPEHLRYDPATGKGPSYDWCRFRRTRRCFYPRRLNEEASDEAGYAVWVPEDRGFCPRDPWEGELGQMSCPVSEPGPNAKPPHRPLADATVAWEDGGQRYDDRGNPIRRRRAASLEKTAHDESVVWNEWSALQAKFPSELLDWRLKIVKPSSGKAAGVTMFATKTVNIAPWAVQQLSMAQLLDTIRHEAAHCMAGAAARHGPLWKAACYRTGANPSYGFRAETDEGGFVDPGYKFLAICPTHGVLSGWLRAPKATSKFRCPKCKQPIEIAINRKQYLTETYPKAASINSDLVICGTVFDAAEDDGWYESGTRTMRGQITGKPHYWRDGRPICKGSARSHGKPLREGWYGSYCSACEKKLTQERRTGSKFDVMKVDSEFAFHFTATWKDVQAKAKRIHNDGHVRIISSSPAYLVGEVRGDTDIYQTTLQREGTSKRVAMWECGCAWASYSWGRSGRWKKYEGRMCSHALALNYEGQSRGWGGQEITEDTTMPEWRSDPSITVKVPGDYKRPDIGNWRLDAALGVKGIDECKFCGSESLFDAYFDEEGYAVTNPSIDGIMMQPDAEWKTVCQDCGEFQEKARRKKKALWEPPALEIARDLQADGLSMSQVFDSIMTMGCLNAPTVLNYLTMSAALGEEMGPGFPRGWFKQDVLRVRMSDPYVATHHFQEGETKSDCGRTSRASGRWTKERFVGAPCGVCDKKEKKRQDAEHAELERRFEEEYGETKEAAVGRSGVPEVDAAIQAFLNEPLGDWTTDDTLIRNLTPAQTHGNCESITEQFVDFAKARGLKAYVTRTDLDELGYKIKGDPHGEVMNAAGEIVMGHYTEHTIASIYPAGSNFPVEIDFSASQYGYTDHPKVLSSVVEAVQKLKPATGPSGVLLDGRPATHEEHADVDYQRFEIDGKIYAMRGSNHQVEIQEWGGSNQVIGRIYWLSGGEIIEAIVNPKFRRKGIASAMLEMAQKIDPSVHHSNSLSEDAKDWIEGLGVVKESEARDLGNGVTLLIYGDQIVILENGLRAGQITWESKQDKRAFSEDDDVWPQALGDSNGYYLEVDALFVDPEFRRKGYGTYLFNAFKEMAEKRYGPKGWTTGEFTGEGAAWWKAYSGENVTPSRRIDVKRMFEESLHQGAKVEEGTTVFRKNRAYKATGNYDEATDSYEMAPTTQPNRKSWGKASELKVLIGYDEETRRYITERVGAKEAVEEILKDEPEPALPSTTGEEEDEPVIDDEIKPGDERLAWLMKDTPTGGKDDMNVAEAARTYLAKTGVKNFTAEERRVLIEEGEMEGVVASNLDLLDIAGTHYEPLEEAYQAQDAEWWG